jgi:outer membrane biosynthesis protein TonB
MKHKREGFIGTIIVHVLILALLLLGGLTFPDPPPEEEGVLVNFGTDDTGFGFIEPKGDEANQGNPEPDMSQYIPEESNEPASIPIVNETAPPDNTQDVEEVIVKEDPKPTAEEIRKQEQEKERIRKEKEIERQKLAELERIRKEKEAEQKRLEEEKRIKDEQADRLNTLGKNTFGRQGVGSEEGSEGVPPGSGTNQGSVTGTPGADNYGNGSGLGDGPAYGLGSRKAVGQLPLPNVSDCSVTSRIIVKVEIQVDREGNVVSARVEEATFADNCIWKVVIEAARKTRFSVDPNASFRQTGWIQYTIEP